MESERFKRPEPERDQPIRNWSTLYGSPDPPPPRREPDQDPVRRGVNLGYEVVEEYLRQGERAARSFGAGGVSPQAWAGEIQGLTSRTMQFAWDFLSMWFELMGALSSLGGGAGPGGRPGFRDWRVGAPETPRPFGAGSFAAGPAYGPPGFSSVPPAAADARDHQHGAGGGELAAPPVVALEADGSARVEVIVDIRPGPAGRRLIAHDLRAPGGDHSRIQNVTIEVRPEDRRVSVRLRIPPGQPAGTYSGLVLDEEESIPRGTLCVKVLAGATASASG
jgi:hypothetical protein